MCSFNLLSIDLTEWRTDIAYAVSAESSAKYSVLTRAWDGVIDGGGGILDLIVVVNDLASDTSMKDALKAIKDDKFQFKPNCRVISQTDFQQADFVEFSCHPAKFYTLYLSKGDEEALRGAVTTLKNDIRSFPIGDRIAKEFSKLPNTEPMKTYSVVTSGTKHVASITPRCKSQNAVMNNIGAPSVGICYFFGSYNNPLFRLP